MRHKDRSPKSNKRSPKVDNIQLRQQRTDIITADGEIIETLGYENFRVALDNGITILSTVSGRVRQNHIRIITGDRVQVEISPYDLTRGRIMYRYNIKK